MRVRRRVQHGKRVFVPGELFLGVRKQIDPSACQKRVARGQLCRDRVLFLLQGEPFLFRVAQGGFGIADGADVFAGGGKLLLQAGKGRLFLRDLSAVALFRGQRAARLIEPVRCLLDAHSHIGGGENVLNRAGQPGYADSLRLTDKGASGKDLFRHAEQPHARLRIRGHDPGGERYDLRAISAVHGGVPLKPVLFAVVRYVCHGAADIAVRAEAIRVCDAAACFRQSVQQVADKGQHRRLAAFIFAGEHVDPAVKPDQAIPQHAEPIHMDFQYFHRSPWKTAADAGAAGARRFIVNFFVDEDLYEFLPCLTRSCRRRWRTDRCAERYARFLFLRGRGR